MNLEVRGLGVRFGGVRAVEDVSFTAAAGEIVGLIGPNGAGKTTLFNLISGIIRPSTGQVLLDGRRLTGLSVHGIARLGVSRTFQTPQIFDGLTVTENLLVGLHLDGRAGLWETATRLGRFRREERVVRQRAEGILRGSGLAELADAPADILAFGQERLLEIQRALARGPKLLLLDEPLSGLNPAEAEEVLTLVQHHRGEGRIILLVEHDLRSVLRVADRLVVLENGRRIAEGPPEEVRRDPLVQAAYLGRDEA